MSLSRAPGKIEFSLKVFTACFFRGWPWRWNYRHCRSCCWKEPAAISLLLYDSRLDADHDQLVKLWFELVSDLQIYRHIAGSKSANDCIRWKQYSSWFFVRQNVSFLYCQAYMSSWSVGISSSWQLHKSQGQPFGHSISGWSSTVQEILRTHLRAPMWQRLSQ